MSHDPYAESSLTRTDPHVDDYLGISPSLFNSIMQGYPNSEEDLQKALDNLLDLPDLDIQPSHFEQDAQSIEQALQDNEALQNKVKDMITAIDQRLQQNGELMKEAIQLALAENRFRTPLRKTTTVHKEYEKTVDFFDKEDLLLEVKPADDTTTTTANLNDEDDNYTEFLEDIGSEYEDEEEEEEEEDTQNKADNQASLQQKSWSRQERQRLAEAIQAEAKRMKSIEFVEKNEAWRVWEVDKLPATELESFPVTRLDWERISSKYVLTRTPKECLIQWTIQEHPSINKRPWTNKESARLSELVDEIGLFSGQWERIASELGTNRTIAQCFSHYMWKKNNDTTKTLKWTAEEDKKLKDAVKVYGNCNWQQIASFMKGRTGQQCLHRWSKTLNPAIKRQKWTEEESKLLKRAVHLYGEGNWTKVQRLVPGRTDMQCRERYVNVENSKVDRSKMTEEETEKLFKLVEIYGRQWSRIAQEFEGRTDNALMRHYDNVMKKKNRAENEPPAKKRKIDNKPPSAATTKKTTKAASGTKKTTTKKKTVSTAEKQKTTSAPRPVNKSPKATAQQPTRRSTRISKKPT